MPSGDSGTMRRPGAIGVTVDRSTASWHTQASGPTWSHAPWHPAPSRAAKMGRCASRAAEPRRGAVAHGPLESG